MAPTLVKPGGTLVKPDDALLLPHCTLCNDPLPNTQPISLHYPLFPIIDNTLFWIDHTLASNDLHLSNTNKNQLHLNTNIQGFPIPADDPSCYPKTPYPSLCTFNTIPQPELDHTSCWIRLHHSLNKVNKWNPLPASDQPYEKRTSHT